MRGCRLRGSALFFLMLVAASEGGVLGQTIAEFPISTSSFGPSEIIAGPDGNLWFIQGFFNNHIGRITINGVITLFPLPTPLFAPSGIVAGPDGNLWFTGSSKIGRITTGGTITEFTLPTPNNLPSAMVVGPDGALWFTENRGNNIGRITTGGAVTEFPIPTENSTPSSIAVGLDGNLWFTEQDAKKIGRITTTGTITEFPIPGASGLLGPPTAGPDGNLWFLESARFTPCCNKIRRVTMAGTIIEFPIPDARGPLQSLTVGPDRNLWFLEDSPFPLSCCGRIWRISTVGVLAEFSIPAERRIPDRPEINVLRKLIAGPDGNLWFTEGGSTPGPVSFLRHLSKIGRITTAGVITEFPIPTVQGNPSDIVAGPDGNLWFTEFMGNKIGRISTGPCAPDPSSLCLNNTRFQVQVGWRVPSQGTSGSGSPVRISADSGYFWFFNSTNVELVVKVLDGRIINGHFWVFYAALSNVEYMITVTDMETGRTKTYFNPEGQLVSVADTSAF